MQQVHEALALEVAVSADSITPVEVEPDDWEEVEAA